MDYLIQPADRASFLRCRRAWDFGARARQNLEPADGQPAGWRPTAVVDRALHDALAIYYFPGMWDWPAAIVLPRVRHAYERSVRDQLRALPPDRAAECGDAVAHGRGALEAYFEWAPTVDRLAPIRVATDVDVHIPDPTDADRDLATADGWAIRFLERIDLLLIDEDNVYWVLDHRIAWDGWADVDELILEERCLSWCWAWELYYPGMYIAGTIYNELRPDLVEPATQPVPGEPVPVEFHSQPVTRSPVTQHRRTYERPTGQVRAEGGPEVVQTPGEAFRRTRIRRSAAELRSFGVRMAAVAAEMADPSLPVYPNPSPRVCAACAFRPPCIAMNVGDDLAAVLAGSYRERQPEQVEEGRLGGSSWSMGRGAMPPKFPGR
ncbi:MAG TPA: hypothetical protein VLJ59_03320 [Mycobacteriales bacterium]|nr:hypothetical protein [Mycobacteriales bacterium]